MKILIIHNKYGKHSGEETVVNAQEGLLRSHGNEVETYYRSSEEIRGITGQIHAFFSGMYSRRSVRDVRKLVSSQQSAVGKTPDIVHVHNLYPLISPAILPVIKSTHQFTTSPPHHLTSSPPHQFTTSPVKIVMTVHNYRLVCPNGLFFTHGEICEKCAGGKEWNCITHNCENTVFKSSGYALRNYWARMKRYYLDNVDAFLCLTEFQKQKLTENGFPPEKCYVLPNFLPGTATITGQKPPKLFVLFAGRVNQQKGFDLLLRSASLLPEINFLVAGAVDKESIKDLQIPGNIEMTGELSKEKMETAFSQALFLVFTSRSYEGFPMVFLEAMKYKLPVIAPCMAGFPEIIEDGFNGLLFKPGDADDLAKKIEILWKDKEMRTRLGENGRKKLGEQYSPEVYYRKLMAVYEGLYSSSPH